MQKSSQSVQSLNNIERWLIELESFFQGISQEIRSIEQELDGHLRVLSADTLREFSLCKKIVFRLGKRLESVRELVEARTNYSMAKAVESLREPLEIPNDPLNSLVGQGNEVEPIDPVHWVSIPTSLLDSAKVELVRIARKRRKVARTHLVLSESL